MNILNRMMDSIRLNDYGDEEDYEYDQEEEREEIREVKYSVPSLFFHTPAVKEETPMEVVMLRPTSMEDAKEISDYLLEGRTVIISLEKLDIRNAPRVIDFTSGAVYCVNGTIERVSDHIFIAAPQAVDLAGSFA
ncbi:MAG: cell division protein SepF [Clostridiaceae bacterium]|nr:cell division protein SepF [Clostridiaceae bacterium]